MITRFLKANSARLFTMTALAAVNAAAAFLALSAINGVATTRTSFETLTEAGVLILVLVGCAALIQSLSARLGADFVRDMRVSFAKTLMRHPYSPGSKNAGHGLSAFINDIAEIAPLALSAPQVAYNLLFVFVAVGYLVYLSAPLAALVLLELALLTALSVALLRSIAPAFDQMRQADDELFRSVRSLEEGRKELLTNRHRADHFQASVVVPAINIASMRMKTANERAGYFLAWSSNTFYITIIITVFFGTELVPLRAGQLASFIVGCLILVGPVNTLVGSVQNFTRGFAALRRLNRFASHYHDNNSEGRCTGKLDWKQVVLTNVRYTYEGTTDRDKTIGPVDLTISRGEIIFLVGPNGSGKTTLLLLLSGLLDPTGGEIRVDRQVLQQVKTDYRESLSVVFCDFHLFEHVLDEDGELAAQERVQSGLVELGLEGVIEVSGGKLSKIDASAGQRKRLALLQLLLENREILVLDEMAADLDPGFKRYFYEELLDQFRSQGKTVILATHDAHYFNCADRVLEFDGGRLQQELNAVRA